MRDFRTAAYWREMFKSEAAVILESPAGLRIILQQHEMPPAGKWALVGII